MTLHQKTFLFSFVVQFYFSRRTPKLGTRGLGGVGGDDNFALVREGSPCGPPPPPRGPPPPPRGPPILVRLSLRWLKRVGAVVTGEGRRKATMIRRQIVEAKPINFILRCSPAAWLPETIKPTQLSRQATKPMRASSCEGQAAWMLKCLLPKLENPCRLYISVALRVADPAYSGIAYMVWDKNPFKYLPHLALLSQQGNPRHLLIECWLKHMLTSTLADCSACLSYLSVDIYMQTKCLPLLALT